jgi:pseudaminic acid synthase
MSDNFIVGNRKIGPGNSTFIVAEVSGNHNQSYKRAVKIIDAAIEAGVDAIKLQTCSPDTLTIDSNKKWFRITKGPWRGQNLYQLYKKAYTPWDWQSKLKKYAEDKGVLLFSTPVDTTAVDFLENLKVKVYKIASFELVDTGLLERIGKTKKPVIISRGMASLEEIKLALKILYKNGTRQIAILHCVSDYPADPKDMNLSTIPDLTKKFKVVTGLSDHTLGVTTSIAAVALGASIIEKHVTIKRSDGGPDAAFSLEPKELRELVVAIREVEQSLGKPMYKVAKVEEKNIIFRRSLFVIKDMKKGEKFTKENIRSIRPGYGLAPKYINKILNKIATKDIERGTPLSWKLIK